MITYLEEERFQFITKENKDFILAFDNEIKRLGYSFGGSIGTGFCWGKYMIIYSKTGVKNKQVAARIYIKEDSIVLRLYLNDIDKHRGYIENSKDFIKGVFTGEHASCLRCHNDKGGVCRFRKTYTIDNKIFEKCNGITFEFPEPDLVKLPDYMDLLQEFYVSKKSSKA